MHNLNLITLPEWGLHIGIFVFAIFTLVMMFIAYNKMSRGEIRRIVGLFWFAFLFSTIRWIGGSLARINFDFTDSIWFNIAWTGAGVLSGLFGIYASFYLLKFSRIYGFKKR